MGFLLGQLGRSLSCLHELLVNWKPSKLAVVAVIFNGDSSDIPAYCQFCKENISLHLPHRSTLAPQPAKSVRVSSLQAVEPN